MERWSSLGPPKKNQGVSPTPGQRWHPQRTKTCSMNSSRSTSSFSSVSQVMSPQNFAEHWLMKFMDTPRTVLARQDGNLATPLWQAKVTPNQASYAMLIQGAVLMVAVNSQECMETLMVCQGKNRLEIGYNWIQLVGFAYKDLLNLLEGMTWGQLGDPVILNLAPNWKHFMPYMVYRFFSILVVVGENDNKTWNLVE